MGGPGWGLRGCESGLKWGSGWAGMSTEKGQQFCMINLLPVMGAETTHRVGRLQSFRKCFTLELFGCISFNSCQVINSLAEKSRKKRKASHLTGKRDQRALRAATRKANAENRTPLSDDSRRHHLTAF